MKCLGHVTQHSSLVTTIIEDIVYGRRGRCWPMWGGHRILQTFSETRVPGPCLTSQWLRKNNRSHGSCKKRNISTIMEVATGYLKTFSETGVLWPCQMSQWLGGLVRTVMESMVPGSRGRHQPSWRLTEDIKDLRNWSSLAMSNTTVAERTIEGMVPGRGGKCQLLWRIYTGYKDTFGHKSAWEKRIGKKFNLLDDHDESNVPHRACNMMIMAFLEFYTFVEKEI